MNKPPHLPFCTCTQYQRAPVFYGPIQHFQPKSRKFPTDLILQSLLTILPASASGITGSLQIPDIRPFSTPNSQSVTTIPLLDTLEIIKTAESYKKVDGKYEFSYLNLILREGSHLYFAKGPYRQSNLCLPELSDKKLLLHKDRGPKVQKSWLILPPDYTHDYYMKTPDLWCYTEKTDLVQQIVREVEACEMLKLHPHPNIAFYGGCHSTNGRVSSICHKRYTLTLQQKVNHGHLCKSEFLLRRHEFVDDTTSACLDGILSGLLHLHSLGLVHNDITPSNIMFEEDGTSVIIDFDSCRKVGEALNDGIRGTKRTHGWHDPGVQVASEKNDLDTVAELRTWLVGVSSDEYLFKDG